MLRFILIFSLVAGTAFSCSEVELPEEEYRSLHQEMAVPGPWDPPAHTRMVAATQYVPVVDPPTVSPLGSCQSNNAFACSCTHPACTRAHPGTNDLNHFLLQRFPFLRPGGTYCCRQNSAALSRLSVHATGRAIDLMVPLSAGDANNALGDQVANFLVENAEFIGIQRVVWDKAFWNGERGFGLLGPNSSPHIDHLHIELSQAGAARQTAFFTSGAVHGACEAACVGTRAVQSNCSFEDCALSGAECLPGQPPRCGEPPPPEPDEAEFNGSATVPAVRTLGTPGRVQFVTPSRILDTRHAELSTGLRRGDGSNSGGVTAEAHNFLSLDPGAEQLRSIWPNITVVPRDQAGFLSVSHTADMSPATSTLNFAPGRVRANVAPVYLGDNREFSIYSTREVDVIADVNLGLADTGDGLQTVTPQRVFDSRSFETPLSADTTLQIDMLAPENSSGVVASMAVIPREGPGYLQVFRCSQGPPPTSSINFGEGQVAANMVLAALDRDGTLCVRSTHSADLVVDVQGYLGPNSDVEFQHLAPMRLLDTRSEESLYHGRLGHHQVIRFPIQALGGMPEAAWSVALNITALGADQPGYASAYPCDISLPPTSSLNFSPGGPVAALTMPPLGPSGEICVFASARTFLIVDLIGVWVHANGERPPVPSDVRNPFDQGDIEGHGHEDEEHGPAPDQGVDAREDFDPHHWEGVEVNKSTCATTGGNTEAIVLVLFSFLTLHLRRRRRKLV